MSYLWKWSMVISLFVPKINEFSDSTNTFSVGWMLRRSCILSFLILAHFRCNFVSADSLVAEDTLIDLLRDLIQNAHHQHSSSVLSVFALICEYLRLSLSGLSVVRNFYNLISKIKDCCFLEHC
jgi:hypothetical protein